MPANMPAQNEMALCFVASRREIWLHVGVKSGGGRGSAKE